MQQILNRILFYILKRNRTRQNDGNVDIFKYLRKNSYMVQLMFYNM